MKTISGKASSTTPISLSDAAKSLSKFARSDQGASHAVSYYIQRAADSFNKLVQFHEKLRPNKEHSVDDVKVEDFSENKRKIRRLGGKVEDVVKQEDSVNGFIEKKKSKNHGKEIENLSKIDKVKGEKIKNDERCDIGEGGVGKSKKNEVGFGKNDSVVKAGIVVEEVKEDGVMSRDKKRKKKKNKGVGENEGDDQTLIMSEQLVDIGEGEVEKSKKNKPEFGKIDNSVKMETGVEEVKEDGNSDKKKKKKKKNEGVGDIDGEDQTLIKTEQRLDMGEGETAISKKNELEFGKDDSFVERETGLQEDGMISSDKMKKKKKNKGVGDGEVGKVEGDLAVKEAEQRKKRKSVDSDAGSAEQGNKKKSKKRRIEGEK